MITDLIERGGRLDVDGRTWPMPCTSFLMGAACATRRFVEKAFPTVTVKRLGLLLAFVVMSQFGVQMGNAAPQFAVLDLGPESANFISHDGLVLGEGLPDTPWLWQNGQRVPLNLNGHAHAVNRWGCVAGELLAGVYRDSYGDFVPYYHACLWSNGVVTDLGTLGGRASQAWSVNNSNVLVGTADDATQVQRPFVWRNGTMSPLLLNALGTNGWAFTVPMRITDEGRIFAVGTFQGTSHAVQLSPAVGGVYNLADLGALNGPASSLNAFNQSGWACGEGEFYQPLRVEAFLLRGTTSTLLGNLGSDGSYGISLNDFGDVVGSSDSRSYRAFLWRD